MFDFFDRNSDGVISRSELIEAVDVLLNKKGTGESSGILKDYDADNNGVIDFGEFVRLCDDLLNIDDDAIKRF